MFEIRFRGEDTVVLSGRLDASHEAVAESFLAALDRSMTVDFDELKYIGSNGLGLLFAAQARLLEKGESLKLVVGVGRVQAAEDVVDPYQHPARPLQSLDGVLERGRLGAFHDGCDLRQLLLHPLLDRRSVVPLLNLLERRRLERRAPFVQQRVPTRRGGSVLRFAAEARPESQNGNRA